MKHILVTMAQTWPQDPRNFAKLRTLDCTSDYESLPPVQHQEVDELFWMLDKIKHCRSILEIGSYAGDTLQAMAMVCGRGTRLRSIDSSDRAGLSVKIAELREHGYDAERLIADSASEEAFDWAICNGPYDFIFIDGDHDYPAVHSDWEDYVNLAPIVGFHDIANEALGVARLWREIKQDHFVMEKIIIPGYMGIGLALTNSHTLLGGS